MGNEQSQLSGLELEEKAVEVTDFWAHHTATVNSGNITNLSVFIGEPLVGGSLWVSHTPLEKAGKNLMIHRHPCILKYISSWHKGSKFYLAVEEVKPLSHVLLIQNTLQICIGLHSILKALSFLHDKALSSHNNLCTASIYVTKDGNWKLGGMEYLCRFQDMTAEYLSKTRAHRYDKSVDPNEDKNLQNSSKRKDFIDIYAFSVLAKEILKNKNDDDIPAVSIFKTLCKEELQHENVACRPVLNSLLDHPFFSHEFISIHSFLTELPLKSDPEKTEFFSNLRINLRKFDDAVVGNQLGGLLLSRMVLLNKTAQSELLPYVLCPREGPPLEDNGLFTLETFRMFLAPKLLEIFCVRDAQIRLLLLNHFAHFMSTFTREELQSHILPELLVGIKDTNDHLVAVTLRALAELVSILGAATVIGGKRAKLFNDGRPIVHAIRNRPRRNSRRTHDLPTLLEHTSHPSIPEDISNGTSSMIEVNQILELPERPSPDGEEGETSTEEIEQSAEDDLDNWEDWGINEETSQNVNSLEPTTSNVNMSNMYTSNVNNPNTNNSNTNHSNANNINRNTSNSGVETNVNISTSVQCDENSDNLELALQNVQISLNNVQLSTNNVQLSTNDVQLPTNNSTHKKSLPDILELDIKNQKNRKDSADYENFNFFQDMEPVIESTTKFLITDDLNGLRNNFDSKENNSKSLDLGVKGVENHEEGWGEDLDW